MNRSPVLFAVSVALLLLGLPLFAQTTVKEPSTGKSFPAEVRVSHAGTDYQLKITGLTVRKKLFFKVYGMAHYMQDAEPMTRDAAFSEILTDGKAKQISMDFARNVTTTQIRDAYNDGFNQNATPAELQEIKPFIGQFMALFDKDVKENDQFTLQWLPGGKIIAIVQGSQKAPIVNKTFAKVLWTIWFGGDSIVDRDDLVGKLTGD
jgi:hypothetical protein